jgi:glycosyltransferase involved in cell wall biosynthesis
MTNAPTAVSVVSPVYGCRSCLEELVDRVAAQFPAPNASFEMLLVDDGSPDGAWSRIVELASTRPWLRGLRLARNFGQHYAIAAGIEHARGDVVVVMDCDLQDVPEEIPKLLAALDADPDVSVAFGQRIDRNDGAIKRFFSWAFFRTLSWLTGVKQDHTTANFGAYRRKVIDAVNRMPERDRCFPLMVKWTGFRSASVPVQHAARTHGQSGYSFSKLLKLAVGIVLSYSDKPLRLVVRMGLAFSAVAVAMAFASVYRYFQGDIQVAGFTSIIASVWLLGGASIFCLGVVGLYVGKQFNDSKGRPYYIVDKVVHAGNRDDLNRSVREDR